MARGEEALRRFVMAGTEDTDDSSASLDQILTTPEPGKDCDNGAPDLRLGSSYWQSSDRFPYVCAMAATFTLLAGVAVDSAYPFQI
ncbi:hypothetical protein PPTG_23314 [Phytophthora nicotianae INRA-310]|uniref:Uncharacterized protein n=1 Tax=Phytophthora nicotianae (strain INRA-310) TaxID=761204 RepID=W2Q0V4_PHYN3|nr:hypothetical protein PPTG_23314 [Phytophthora nicotianae INRA-310]ETN06526.1 hypothetical protein PPTG_23314 [Phytophthora nicotianae INRA-310]